MTAISRKVRTGICFVSADERMSLGYLRPLGTCLSTSQDGGWLLESHYDARACARLHWRMTVSRVNLRVGLGVPMVHWPLRYEVLLSELLKCFS